MSDPGSLVLVSGVTGMVGSQLMVHLLEAGYRVRGTVRSLGSRKTKFIDGLLSAHPDWAERLELVQANLLDNAVWDKVVEGCEFICHVANPTVEAKVNDASFVTPAVEGMRAILAAAKKHGVKRLVYTGSTSTCVAGDYSSRSYDESDLGDASKATPYERSKILAERTLFSFAKENDMEVCCVLCGFITGAGPNKGNSFPAGELIGRMLSRSTMPLLPRISHPIVDVHDVAKAHILALESPVAPGKRYVLVNGQNLWYVEMAAILRDEFKKFGYKIPRRQCGKTVMRIGAFFEPRTKTLLPYMNMDAVYVNTKVVEELGMTFDYDAKASLLETAYRCIEDGSAKNRLPKK